MVSWYSQIGLIKSSPKSKKRKRDPQLSGNFKAYHQIKLRKNTEHYLEGFKMAP